MNSPYPYRSGRAIVLRGDARHLPLPDASVDLVVTSPPFWQLRSYTDGGEHYAAQIGSERTVQEYIATLLDCTREWIRVLKPTGSLFVELGDKYDSGTTTARVNPGTVKNGQGQGWNQGTPRISLGRAKCLLDLPHRYSIACVDELGLIKRANIVWHHTNGLPESVTDRVRASHSMVFHFTKLPRYYSAVDEIREEHAQNPKQRGMGKPNGRDDLLKGASSGGWTTLADGTHPPVFHNPLGKLPGSVWDIASQPLTVPARLGVDHFAAFPMELPRRIILGWSPPGVCVACGTGRRPVTVPPQVDPAFVATRRAISDKWRDSGVRGNAALNISGPEKRQHYIPGAITGYVCACPTPDAPTRPSVILDPFGGTGTTALVAAMHGRLGVSIDRSADYTRLATWRCNDPAERAKALQVPKPPPIPDGMEALF